MNLIKKIRKKVSAFQRKADRKTAVGILKLLKAITRNKPYFNTLFMRMETEIKEERFDDFEKSVAEFWDYYMKMYGKAKDEVLKIKDKILKKGKD